jgi:hypothetical protein
MKNFLVLLGSFLLTFALLVSVWMVGFGGFGSAAQPTATPYHTPYYTMAATPAPPTPTPEPTPTPTPQPTSTPSPAPTPTPLATPTVPVTPGASEPEPSVEASPAPLRTAPASFVVPSIGADEQTQTVDIAGGAFVDSQVPDGGSITAQNDGIIIATTSHASDEASVTYRLDPSELPEGAVITEVDTKVCGQGVGQFWETYGPVGGTPTEYEAVPPDADGCWHFTNAPADDISVIASTMLDSQLYVDHVEFTVTVSQ